MAIRKKSIRVPVNFGATSPLIATGTTGSLGSTIIYIPENSVSTPVTFSGANLYVAIQDISTVTGATLSNFSASINLSGSATSSVGIAGGGTLANSGENWGGILGPIDYTNYFTASFGTSTAKTASVSIAPVISTGTGTSLSASYAYLELSYIYDDIAPVKSQTICIPYESLNSTLPIVVNNTYATMSILSGSGGLLAGYNSPVIRHRWIEIKGNCNNNGTATNHSMSFAFDAGAATILPARISTLASDTWQLYQINASALTTNQTHSFNLWNNLATRWSNIVASEWVTFEYSSSGTTSVLNYVELPVEFDSPIAGTTAAVAQRFKKVFNIQEPGPIAIQRSAVEINYTTDASATPNIKIGSQAAYKAYAQASSVVAGQFSFQHGISGSSSGNALTLSRGDNDIIIDLYRSAGSIQTTTGIIKLLYSSGTSSFGEGSHNRTIWSYTRNMSLATQTDATDTDFFGIPEPNYYINAAAERFHYWTTSPGVGTTFPVYISSQMSINISESIGAGWRELFADIIVGDSELSYGSWNARMLPEIKKYPRDPDSNLLNVTQSRSFRTIFSTGTRYGYGPVMVYHNITSSVAGTITNSAGGTVTLDLWNVTDNTLYDITTRTGNGTYSFVVYDDTKNYQVVAYESATLKGASKQATPATNFDISLSAGGGEFFF